jgi:uncharacterized membrane protein
MPFHLRLSMLASIVLVILLPFLCGEILLGGLAKLHIGRQAALALAIGIVAGGFINIPVRRIVHQYDVEMHPMAAFGFGGRWGRWRRITRETVIAVNIGGCVIPTAVAVYELMRLVPTGEKVLGPAAAVIGINVMVCWLTARPVPGVGIVMPGLLCALLAAGFAMLLTPGHAAPVAFIAGVAGPLIGADLLHLRDLTGKASGVMSIGGAGTFDGIVLSGIVAAYLA